MDLASHAPAFDPFMLLLGGMIGFAKPMYAATLWFGLAVVEGRWANQ
jgi:hypothetical protein